MHKYVDINRLKQSYESAFKPGEHILIQTKVDGANASFTYDPETDSVVAFSRNTKLDENNNLRGFYQKAQLIPVDALKQVSANGRYVFYGEWLVPHKVKYPEECYNKFYMFDVYDNEIGEYVSYVNARGMWAELFLHLHVAAIDKTWFEYVPEVYDGQFVSWEEIQKFLTITTLGGQPCEEGIVIKSQDRLDNKSSKTPAYVKIVNEKFAEVQKTKKPVDPAVLAAMERDRAIVETIVTVRRIEKFLDKLVDEGTIPEDWDETNMGAIMKVMPRLVYEDCRKEEPEIVQQVEKFGKICGRLVSEYVNEILKTR